MASWEPNDFRTIELDRESRVPDELYPRASCTEGSPPASPEEADDGALAAPAPLPSVEDVTLGRRRSAQSYFNAGLPWTGEFEDLVNEGLVDVS